MTKNERAKLRRQRKVRRFVLTIALMALVAVIAIGGTVAWLTDRTQEVMNTFTTSDIEITLVETKEEFKMVPGCEIAKDPIVTVKAGSEACWLFVKVEESANLDDFIDYQIVGGENGWTAGTGEGGNGVPEGVYYRQVSATDAKAGKEFHVLADDKVTVLNTVTKDKMDAIKADPTKAPTLTFTAYACQKAKFDNAAAAWAEVNPAPVPPPETEE